MNKVVDEYIKLYKVLVNMTDEQLESEEADSIRDMLDPLWYKMNEEEIKYVEQFFRT